MQDYNIIGIKWGFQSTKQKTSCSSSLLAVGTSLKKADIKNC